MANSDSVDFFLLSGDPLIYNVLRTCKIIRIAHDQQGRTGWLVAVDPSIPLLRFLDSGATEIHGETSRLLVFASDLNQGAGLPDQETTRVDVYGVPSDGNSNNEAVTASNSVLYPPSLIHRSRETALKYLSPMDNQKIRDWAERKGLK